MQVRPADLQLACRNQQLESCAAVLARLYGLILSYRGWQHAQVQSVNA